MDIQLAKHYLLKILSFSTSLQYDFCQGIVNVWICFWTLFCSIHLFTYPCTYTTLSQLIQFYNKIFHVELQVTQLCPFPSSCHSYSCSFEFPYKLQIQCINFYTLKKKKNSWNFYWGYIKPIEWFIKTVMFTLLSLLINRHGVLLYAGFQLFSKN